MTTGILAVSAESIFRLIVSLVMFVLVVIACYFTTVWIGNFQKKKVGRGNIEVIEVHSLTNNKYMEIVRVGTKYYVLAVSKDRVDKIDVLDKDDINIPEFGDMSTNLTFVQVLEKLKKDRHQQDKE